MRIETERLVIRSFTIMDIPSYQKIVSDPNVTRYLRNSYPHSPTEAKAYIERTMAEETRTGIARYAVDEKRSGQLVGFCGFAMSGEQVDFGWRYGKRYWGMGYGNEAALAVLDYGLKTLKLTSIVAGTSVENVASLRIIQNLGFKYYEYSEVDGRRVVKYYQRKQEPNKPLHDNHYQPPCFDDLP
jgi:[ribosomal protein S5]-alanine N-acetyltransferase